MKILPALFTLLFFAAATLLIVNPEALNLSAMLNTSESKQFGHYEDVYKELTLELTNGEERKISSSKAPVTILNFWAAWCKPCLEEFPSLVELRKTFSEDQLQIIGINCDEEDQEKNIAKMTEEFSLNFDMVADKEGKLLNQFMINALPVTLIYKNGKVKIMSMGKKDFMAEELLEMIRNP